MILTNDKPEMRRHRVEARAKRNPVLQGLLADFQEFRDASEMAQRAEELAKQTEQADAATESDWPSTSTALTEKWLTAQVERQRGGADAELRVRILRSVEFRAREDAWSHIESRSAALIEQLAAQLGELVAAVGEVADQLGAVVGTAQAAVEAGTADHWKSLSELRRDYDTIRDAQEGLYKCDVVNFDRGACGDGDHHVSDREARLYFHKNLATVAPDWRGHTTTDQVATNGQVQWPADPVEKLLWFVRNDSGIWCPTNDQIKHLLDQQRATEQAQRRNTQNGPRLSGRAKVLESRWNSMSG